MMSMTDDDVKNGFETELSDVIKLMFLCKVQKPDSHAQIWLWYKPKLTSAPNLRQKPCCKNLPSINQPTKSFTLSLAWKSGQFDSRIKTQPRSKGFIENHYIFLMVVAGYATMWTCVWRSTWLGELVTNLRAWGTKFRLRGIPFSKGRRSERPGAHQLVLYDHNWPHK